MDTRRALLCLALGAAGAASARRTGSAQSSDGQPGGQASGQKRGEAGDDGGLRDRGAPTGRTGAATRGARSRDGELALDLVAPLRGVGLTSVDQPVLCYVLLGGPSPGETAQPMRLAISTPGQARPLANLELPRAQLSGLGIIRLRDHGVRLAPNLLCVWSLTLALDPRAPSRDLVGSALIQHRMGDPALEAAKREALLERRVAALARVGYWYDAVTLAERSRGDDQGVALARLFEQEELRVASRSGTGRGSVR